MAAFALGSMTTASAWASSKPFVETGSATKAGETTATLNGVVNPNGAVTGYYFEYGPTTSYGSKTAEGDAGLGESNLKVSSVISGLKSNTTYHYRLVATNINGTTEGAGERVYVGRQPPEFTFVHCVKLASKKGEYTSSTCPVRSETETGEFEKEAVSAGSKIKFTEKLGRTSSYLNASGSFRLGCREGTATGEVSGPKELTDVRVALHGCKGYKGSEECPLKSVGAGGAEEIVSTELSGKLGQVAAAEAPSSERGLDLKPTTANMLVEMIGACFPETRLVGSVIGEVELTRVMGTTAELRFGVKGGEGKKNKQTIQKVEGEAKDTLTWFGAEVGFESADEITFEEPIEVA
jgi:hypothetical protein